MTTTVLRPNETILTGGDSVVGGGTRHSATSDDSDTTYVSVPESAAASELGLTTKTFASGEISKSLTLRTRAANGSSITFKLIDESGKVLETARNPGTIGELASAIVPYSGTSFYVEGMAVRFQSFAGTTNVYEIYVDLVTVAKPVAVATAVTDPYTASTQVPIRWTSTLDSDGGAQTHYQVYATDDDDGDAVVYDSGILAGDNEVRSAGPLPNGNYTAHVRVAQTVNGAQHWSSYDTVSFEVDVSTSDISTVVGVATDADGKITVTATRDASSELWGYIDIQKSEDTGVTWTPVRGATFVEADINSPTFAVDDYEAPNGVSTTYRSRATYYSSGLPITGDWTTSAAVSWSSSTIQWLKSPDSPSLNVAIDNVNVFLESIGDVQRFRRDGVHRVLGLRTPIVVSDVLPAGDGWLLLDVRGSASALAIDALLDSDRPLLMNLDPTSLMGPDRNGFQYFTVRPVREYPLTEYLSDARLIEVRYTTVDRPTDLNAGTL